MVVFKWEQLDPVTGKYLNDPPKTADDPAYGGFNHTFALEICNANHEYAVSECSVPVWDERTMGDSANRPPNYPHIEVGIFAFCRDKETGMFGGMINANNDLDGMDTGEVPAELLGKPIWSALLTNWCERCVHPTSGHVDDLSGWKLPAINVSAMGLADYITYLFAGLFVALTMVGEMKDIQLCDFCIDANVETLQPKWRITLRLLNGMRRWIFLPVLMLAVLSLIVFKGGDALTIVFNTIGDC
eukprot:SAG31_NODE_7352_length_1712_cov_1.132052_2_plen_244_part_00